MIYCGDSLTVLKGMADESVDMCVTSPPYYGLRDYGEDGQIGLEDTPEQFIKKLVDVFREVRRVLKDDGTLWVNIGDSYAGSWKGPAGNLGKTHDERNMTQSSVKQANVPVGCKPKDLIGIPWMLAFALRADGWYLRQDIIWHKPNPMPESVKDRCTKSHEYLFLLSKSPKYYFNSNNMKEKAVYTSSQGRKSETRYGGKKYTDTPNIFNRTKSGNAYAYTGFRNKRDVWSVSTKPYSGAHFAVFPEKLIEPCIMAGSKHGGIVLDPFSGAGTTGVVCKRLGREYIGIELNREYVALSEKRIKDAPEFQEQLSLF